MGRIILRQGGEVFIQEEIPSSATLEATHKLVISGETGKAHTLTQVNVYTSMKAQYVQVYKPAELTHPEHPALIIQPGSYRIAHIRDRDVADLLFMPAPTQQAARTTPRD